MSEESPSVDAAGDSNVVPPGNAHPDTSPNEELARIKLELEIAKLRLDTNKTVIETLNLQRPFRRNPALWITTATTLLAVAGFVWQMLNSQNEKTLASIEAANMRSDLKVVEESKNKALSEKSDADAEKKKLDAQIATKKLELDDAAARLAATQAQLKQAADLLVKAKPSVSEPLKVEIETFEQIRKRYDPTGKFPFHVPP